jgi:hypothetical protein
LWCFSTNTSGFLSTAIDEDVYVVRKEVSVFIFLFTFVFTEDILGGQGNPKMFLKKCTFFYLVKKSAFSEFVNPLAHSAKGLCNL